ncbi:MAG: TetR/AcrR family transcriptional regulator [Clostridia bacterium]|nr:TetR/AcrR family transcriptional regulator [Clostridia bacterium]
MANIRNEVETAEIRRKILIASTELFMEKGYERTTVQDIAKLSGIPKAKIFYEMKSKEEILGALVTRYLDGVTKASDAVSTKLTEDKSLILIANEVLQLCMAEQSEDMRNLYLAGYSLPKTSEAVLLRRTNIMYDAFCSQYPQMQIKDFYEIEIAAMGIMRAYMSVPCDLYFTLEAKVNRFTNVLLRIYNVSEEKINEVHGFLTQIDFESVANEAIESVFRDLAIKKKK